MIILDVVIGIVFLAVLIAGGIRLVLLGCEGPGWDRE